MMFASNGMVADSLVDEMSRRIIPLVSVTPGGSQASSGGLIGDVMLQTEPALPEDRISTVLKRFQTDKGLQVLPVVEQGHAVGIINRSTFLEENVIGMHGFAYQINHFKTMRDLMIPVPLSIEADTPIRHAARSIQEKGHNLRVDNVCITRNGLYAGMVDVNGFIGAITEINLTLAMGANPLTGLPGNESIQREINDRLQSGQGFDIAYLDIDNFKPFNDHYGFQKGDEVIKTVACVLLFVAASAAPRRAPFCGHIGGDDFIIISEPGSVHAICQDVVSCFNEHLLQFHGEQDVSVGAYTAVNRKGETETFHLLSLSIGIVNTLLTPVSSYAQLASLSTEVKKAAKSMGGGGIVINRREGQG
ncbi:MAG TPA: GGDEF domain-containing protein [Deltaproteobacteria bacterium]|nr:GGDEF domain-containing protein [Deltaproteobacteria bacterium]HQB39097.1 GGDEF domain-containing protein [Deltaproteobacteria bacterium]